MNLYAKDRQAEVDYLIDWGSTLAGRTICNSDWAVSPCEAGGVEIVGAAQTPMRTRARLAGGVPGRTYRVTGQVTFSDGRRDTRSLALRVEAR